MKKNVLALAAIVCTIVFSSFTASKFGNVYMVFKGSGAETAYANYTQQTAIPATHPAADEIYWFVVADGNNFVTEAEFDARVEQLDTDEDGFLSDEAEIPQILEKRNSF